MNKNTNENNDNGFTIISDVTFTKQKYLNITLKSYFP